MNVPVTITLDGIANVPVGNMGYVEFDETASYVDLNDGGVIFISDFLATFPGILSKVIKLDLFVKTSNGWQDYPVSPENISYDTEGNLKTIRWNLNSLDILKLKGKIY